MIIAIVNGSPRANGATGKLLREIGKDLMSKEDVVVKHFDLAEYSMKFCAGCMLCHRTGKCIITDDGINEVAAELKQCDAVVFGSPTYASNISGQLKTLIDRGGFVFGQLLAGKYGFAVSTYENANGKAALKVLENLMLFSGASRRGSFLLKLDHNTDPISDPKVLKDLHRETEKFYHSVKSRVGMTLLEKAIYKIALNKVLKPRMLNHSENYAGNIQRWKELNLL